MPDRKTVDAFIAAVTGSDFIAALERFYAPDARTRENLGAWREGRETLIEGERGVLKRFPDTKSECLGVVIDGDRVAIQWHFTFANASATRSMTEIAWQRWRGEEIVEEEFFYDPAQMRG